MNIWQLFFVCLGAILRGKGNARVLFDTEAQHFDVHMVPVDRAYCENVLDDWTLNLHEDHPHRSGVCVAGMNAEEISVASRLWRVDAIIQYLDEQHSASFRGGAEKGSPSKAEKGDVKWLERAAQMWCGDKHAHKVMDPDLAQTIASALQSAYEEGRKSAECKRFHNDNGLTKPQGEGR